MSAVALSAFEEEDITENETSLPIKVLKSNLAIYLNMKHEFLTTRSCYPTPSARDTLMLAHSALLGKEDSNWELQSLNVAYSQVT